MDGYPRTPHLSFSPGINPDDVVCDEIWRSGDDLSDVVITEKLDGGNCCLHKGMVFARTHRQEATHASFGPIKSLAAQMASVLLPHLAYFGEAMVAVHSIEYTALSSYFYLFGVFDTEQKVWLSWDEVTGVADGIGVPTVPVVYRGAMMEPETLRKWMEDNHKKESALGGHTEGFVVRSSVRIREGEFGRKIAKFVRRGHLQTDETWKAGWKKAQLH